MAQVEMIHLAAEQREASECRASYWDESRSHVVLCRLLDLEVSHRVVAYDSAGQCLAMLRCCTKLGIITDGLFTCV